MKHEPVRCDARDVATKSFFLGPQAENGPWFHGLMSEILGRWLDWRKRIFPADGVAISGADQLEAEFKERQGSFKELALELSRRFENEIPKFSPRYLGHMFSEISLPALIGHWIATLHNPNLISSESALVGVEIEREAIAELMEMVGFPRNAPGHFTSCGSIANLEAALRARDRARQRGRDPIFLVPRNKHYSWLKAAHVLGVKKEDLIFVDLDRYGTLDLSSLKARISELAAAGKKPALVVSVLGTTELGNIDPIHDVQDIIESMAEGTWHHVDAAYGGFFTSLRSSNDGLLAARVKEALIAVPRVDSLTIDPHKLGYVPYACGAFLCRDGACYSTELFDSPYIQYERGRDPGQFTLEGSRSASGAAATWLTLRAIGTGAEGYGRIVARTIRLRIEMEKKLQAKSLAIRVLPHHHTNILCFTVGKSGQPLSEANAWVEDFYQTHSGGSGRFFVSKTALPISGYREMTSELFHDWRPQLDAPDLHLIRLTLMNPFLGSKEMNSHIMDDFCAEVARSASL